MPDLISAATTAELLKDTGGVLVTHGAETTYGHLEQVPVEVLEGGEPGVITGEPSLVIPNGAFTGITHRTGVGETVTTQALDAAGSPTGPVTSWVVRDLAPDDADGGTIRVMLRTG